MRTNSIGRSGLRVSAVGLGCNNFSARLDFEGSRAVLDKALDAGITLFDTADVYGKGGSEEFLGRLLGARRKDIVLATKFNMEMGPGLKGNSRRYVMRAVEASLKRLQTDWIDLYQIHQPDPETPIEETLRALDDLVTQGKVRYIGVSNFPAWSVVDAQWTARHHGLSPLVSCQDKYNLLEREAEAELIPAMLSQGIGLLPYYPLAGGFLSGKYQRGAAPGGDTRLGKRPELARQYLTDRNWQRLEQFRHFAGQHGRSLVELAFAWLLSRPVLASVIAGASTPEQVEANVKAAEWRLSPQDVAAIEKLEKLGSESD